MDWQKKIKKWLCSADCLPDAIENVYADALAPMILRRACSGTGPTLVVLPVLTQADRLQADIALWQQELELPLRWLYLPETHDGQNLMPGNEAQRARALHRVLSEDFDLIIGSVASLLSTVPAPEKIKESQLCLRRGCSTSFNDLLEALVTLDYDDEFEVNVECEFSRRGGIIDVYSPAHNFPARIEFWGDEVDSIRSFDPETQRSTGALQEYLIIGRGGIDDEEAGVDFFTFTESKISSLSIVFPEACFSHLEKFSDEAEIERFRELLNMKSYHVARYFDPGEVSSGDAVPAACFPAAAHLKQGLPAEAADGGMELLRQLIARQLSQWLDTGYEVLLFGNDPGAEVHIKTWCKEHEVASDRVTVASGKLPAGILFPAEKTVFITERELFTANYFRKKSALPPAPEERRALTEQEVAACADLDEGDYAVHLIHGIGIFKGIKEMELRGVKREVMVLEYRDNAQLYVPLYQAAMVSRYIGAQAKVKLHKLGDKRWLAAKAGTARAIKDFAAELLRFQAVRNASEGIKYPADGLEQRIFEDAFPFKETPDQAKAVNEVKADMCASRPMDRLLCGDVGYGKTEVAIRTAFKAVEAGYQAAVLVPTTVLAQQHYYSFKERFAEYPYTIEMLSRFRSRQQQSEIVRKIRSGGIDVIIGTHRLFQDDVHFKKLGLVVIDEEQRFGVKHKEKIKRFRTAVDVLTMSATPIPRTLYMAMAGARDLSTIMTAPGLRLPVKTIISQYDDKFICEAVRNEVKRGGQVFFIHNRVKTINSTAEKLMKLMPEVRIGVGHGQMAEGDLETVMADFLRGEIDVLLCTTIIESGLDIPNANTIIIERADRFGLAELYQLRGRVGRWSRQAYAYLLLPKSNIISSDARKRLGAIRRYTHLGAGFRLALRDLEIRGAGNLLGAQQSGHVNAVGFDLYCQLLRSEVSRMQGAPQRFLPEVDVNIDFLYFAHAAPREALAAGFPPDYIPSQRLRVDAYRRVSAMTSEEELDAFREEMEDRYGTLPEEAEVLCELMLIRILVALHGYSYVGVQQEKVFIKDSRRTFRRNGMLPLVNSENPPRCRLRNLLDIVRLMPDKSD
ncbi:transcription-repair coupling factor [Lentisphaerota bacterium ZTH]|nr:transcription-repair coupling factor [Lentisphaerota bacterium]WET06849.1 transcription-repair coupling factor [Lentisphaerota bacterium ZTH]